jgi:hypothetical protein
MFDQKKSRGGKPMSALGPNGPKVAYPWCGLDDRVVQWSIQGRSSGKGELRCASFFVSTHLSCEDGLGPLGDRLYITGQHTPYNAGNCPLRHGNRGTSLKSNLPRVRSKMVTFLTYHTYTSVTTGLTKNIRELRYLFVANRLHVYVEMIIQDITILTGGPCGPIVVVVVVVVIVAGNQVNIRVTKPPVYHISLQ